MYVNATMPGAERELLRRLVNDGLVAVVQGGWAATIVHESGCLAVMPEEVPAPDREHPYAEVTRVKVEEVGHSEIEEGDMFGTGFGRVRAIFVLNAICSFGKVTIEGPDNLLGVALPPGRSYETEYHERSEGLLENQSADRSMVDVDLGLELVTELGPNIVLFAAGFFVRSSIGQLPPSEPWAAAGVLQRRQLLI
jgi:hypothetical protein